MYVSSEPFDLALPYLTMFGDKSVSLGSANYLFGCFSCNLTRQTVQDSHPPKTKFA